MRILLTFSISSLRLPLAHCSALQGLVYHLLSNQPSYSQALHDFGKGDDKRLKLFTFSELQGRYDLIGKDIIYRDSVCLELRSLDARFLQAILTACPVRSRHRLDGQWLTVRDCRLLESPLFSEECEVAMITPVTIHTTLPDRTTQYFSPTDPEFSRRLVANARRKWKIHASDRPFSLSVTPLNPKAARKLVTDYRGFRINAWYTTLRLQGDPQLLELLYHAGLGDRNAQGFGMFRPQTNGDAYDDH